MKTRLRLLLATSLLAGVSGSAQAYQSYNETYQIMGCRSYMENAEQNRGWLVGYLTAIEMQRGTAYLQNRNLQQVYRQFESYCRANPRRNMDEAADALFTAWGRR